MHPPNSSLHPERALLTPTWLGALALLVANDHWLKGSGLLPGVLTGKLSDFAGLLVAPALLAALLRVKTHKGLLACHVAVGAVFAGIQISTGFAELWSAAMGLLGHPWVITSDLTDLLALPFLWLSWRLLLPAMHPDRPALIGLQRSAVAAASVFGLWATVATSDDGGGSVDEGFCNWCDSETGGGGWEQVQGQIYIHNPNDFAITLNIRVLRPEVQIHCSAIASDPGHLLPDEAFGDAEHWELPPTTNVGVLMHHSCGAAKIAGEGIPEQIIFSDDFYLGSSEWFPGSHAQLSELGPDGAAIVMGENGAEWVGGWQWRHTPKLDSAPQPETCLADPGERHLDWSELPSNGIFEVLSLTAGLDGCYEIDLQRWIQGAPDQTFTWYLCAPQESVRFEVGEFWRLESAGTSLAQAFLVDPLTYTILVDDLGRRVRTLVWERGTANASAIPAPGVQAVNDPSCPWNLDDDCVEVARKLELQIDGQQAIPGVPLVTIADAMRYELIVGRARELGLTAGECGSSSLPHDIDYALVSEPNL